MAARDELGHFRDFLERLERRVYRLELETVKKDGPLVAELRAATTGLAELRREVTSRDELRRELSRQTAELEAKREAGKNRAFGRREKIAALFVAVAVLALQIAQVVLHAVGLG